MSHPLPAFQISRTEAINRLRTALVARTDDENCACKVAAEAGFFCKGFKRYNDDELRNRYWWIVRRRPDITREELETIANDWQLAQQAVKRLPVACDVQARVHDTCLGWDDFTDEQLAVYVRQLTGKDVRIV